MNDDDTRELEWQDALYKYKCAVRDQYESRPEYKGKIFRPKKGGIYENHIPMSYSMTLVANVEGIANLESYWEPEP